MGAGLEEGWVHSRATRHVPLEQKELFERAKAMLENGDLLRTHGWTDRERLLLKPLCLMSTKRMLYVANVTDEDLDGASDDAKAVAARAEATGSEWIPICGDIESELRNMEDEERDLFMADLGIESLGLDRLIQATYKLLGLLLLLLPHLPRYHGRHCHDGHLTLLGAGDSENDISDDD